MRGRQVDGWTFQKASSGPQHAAVPARRAHCVSTLLNVHALLWFNPLLPSLLGKVQGAGWAGWRQLRSVPQQTTDLGSGWRPGPLLSQAADMQPFLPSSPYSGVLRSTSR